MPWDNVVARMALMWRKDCGLSAFRCGTSGSRGVAWSRHTEADWRVDEGRGRKDAYALGCGWRKRERLQWRVMERGRDTRHV